MERMEKKPKKRDVSDFAVTKKKIGPRDKSDFAKGFVPKKKDVSDFAVNTKTKTRRVVGGKKTSVVPKKTFSSFGAAFKDARKRLGAGKTFTYKGKKYTTNLASDKKKVSPKTTANKPTPRPKAKPARNTKPSKMGLDGPKVGVRNGSKPKKKTSNVMSTKTPKFFKGTNITPTKTQRQRMRKKMMGST